MSGDNQINGERPSAAALIGSLMSAVEKPTAENLAQREADAQARQRAILVHSPHALMEFEKDMIRQMGRNPDSFIGVPLAGQVSVQRLPTGTLAMVLLLPVPPGFFPDLEAPAVMDANGNARSTKFDKRLAIPITGRVVCEKDALGPFEGLHDNAILLQQHEGKTFGELLDAGYVPPPGPRLS